MSKKNLRAEKNCLNCGTEIQDRFCSHCGQENLQLNDSAFHLVLHYFQDLFHYDGRLWYTLRNLITKPGQVAHEYMEGKRRQNLEPVRFYVLASTICFLLLYLVVGPMSINTGIDPKIQFSKRLYHLNQEKKFVEGKPDTAHVNALISALQLEKEGLDSTVVSGRIGDVEIDLFGSSNTEESADRGFTHWMQKRINAKRKEMERTHDGDEVKATYAFLDELFHKLPQLLFLSLPFFAFFLKLLYWRSSRKHYVDHFIFSIYHYAYLFILLIIWLILDTLFDKAAGTLVDQIQPWVVTFFWIYTLIYLALAMKRFYKDRWLFVILRYFILMMLFSGTMLMLFLVVAMFAFLW